MAGTPADLTIFIDNNETHDHTYYGRGCSNYWGTEGLGGSATPCADSDAGGRYVNTYDGETQKNGTYYHFQSAVAGSWTSESGDNKNSPDTFCPLGWQLPYAGTGGDYYDKSRSWKYLLAKYTITDDSTGSNALRSFPFSYIFSGYLHFGMGRLYNQGNQGRYRSLSQRGSSYSAYILSLSDNNAMSSRETGIPEAMPIRCVTRY